MPAVPTSRQRSAEPPLSARLDLPARPRSPGMVRAAACSARQRQRRWTPAWRRRSGEHGAELLASIAGTCRAMGLGHAIPDAAITLGAHHLLLRAVPKHPGLALHAVVLDKTHANLTLARLQVQRMDAIFASRGLNHGLVGVVSERPFRSGTRRPPTSTGDHVLRPGSGLPGSAWPRGPSMRCWMARLSGRAPNTGSKPTVGDLGQRVASTRRASSPSWPARLQQALSWMRAMDAMCLGRARGRPRSRRCG